MIPPLFLLNTTDLPPKAGELHMEPQAILDMAVPHCPHRGRICPSWIQTVARSHGEVAPFLGGGKNDCKKTDSWSPRLVREGNSNLMHYKRVTD